MDIKYDEEDETEEEAHIDWSNLIFLPFHPVFQLVVLIAVILKVLLGPIQSIYPIIYCSDVMDDLGYLAIIKYFYWYGCDPIYCVDTVLHIIHRQVTDKAVRREYLPKSGFLLIIDIISLIPFFRLIVNEMCPTVELWPNILSFTEFIIIYRIAEYFSLQVTHSFVNLIVGGILIMICVINCISCFWILLTKHGFCYNCKDNIYDWRNNVLYKLNETDEEFTTYVYASLHVLAYTSQIVIDTVSPCTILEFIISAILIVTGFCIDVLIIHPKIFAECLLRLKRIFTFHPHVSRLVAETKRRNPNKRAYIDVDNFYSLMWTKRNGVTYIPETLNKLPRHLRLEIKQDLCWPVFYHSPILRKTSTAFKNTLCEFIIPDYKLPGEKFYSGPHSLTNLYYVKSGIVQIISADDGTTPILSVTSGTLLGDTSFYVPPTKRKILVRCLTYCEVLFLSKANYLRVIEKYPEDRRHIIQLAKERMKHAKTLFTCKQNVRGLDRSEDENIAWLKRRWWEISVSLANWEKNADKRDDRSQWQIPQEECIYHCPKFIGQLVICNETQLKSKSLFANVNFPWILVPNSSFGVVWDTIVKITVFLVVLLYPPMLTMPIEFSFIMFFKFWVNIIYLMDMIVTVTTAMSYQENVVPNFASVMFERCKTLNFALDIMATLWIEQILVLIGRPKFYKISQLNRLIKSHKLFSDNYRTWNSQVAPVKKIVKTIVLCAFLCVYLPPYIRYLFDELYTNNEITYYDLNQKYCKDVGKCESLDINVLQIFIYWCLTLHYKQYLYNSLTDVYSTLYVCVYKIIWIYMRNLFLSAMYLKNREASNFQEFVTNLKKYYKTNMIHRSLLKRLEKYLLCQWKYYQGADVMNPSKLKDEPYDIYWKVQGEVAEKIIGESAAFKAANPYLIRELAYAAKFLMLPAKSAIFLFGVRNKIVSWIVQGKVKCEYHDENGILSTTFYERGYMLSSSSVFFGKTSLRTYFAVTDCETIYIKLQDFYKIIKRYPTEWSYIENCLHKLNPEFLNLYDNYMDTYAEYKNNLRRRIFQSKASEMNNAEIGIKVRLWKRLSTFIMKMRAIDTESFFIRFWMFVRLITVCLSILCAAIQGGSGALFRKPFIIIGWFCDIIAWIDIYMKLTWAYYDHRGILISDRIKCASHYLSRGFLMDVIGAFPWYKALGYVFNKNIDINQGLLINTICKFSHLYLVAGYFDYYADAPTINATFILIFKWQLIHILVSFGMSHILMSYCVHFTFDDDDNVVSMMRKKTCWIRKIFNVSDQITVSQLHLIYADSLINVQTLELVLRSETFGLTANERFYFIILQNTMEFFSWCVNYYIVFLLLLYFRGNVVFQHGVNQLHKFLSAERIDKCVIERAVAHFTYWWKRTNGINIHHLSNERLGVVFRQDLNYFFYQKTFTALDTILNGGKSLQRELASYCTDLYILPECDIIREMDLITSLYVIHRGRVIITQAGEPIQVLTRGCIFGQLEGTVPRPVRIAAKAESYVDLLTINIKTFQDIIDDEVRNTIKTNPQSRNDYLATNISFSEDPRDTVEYIIRRRQTVKFPWMQKQSKVEEDVWYARWLYLAWFLEPVVSSFIVLILVSLPEETISQLYLLLAVLDLIHLFNLFVEYYTLQITVVGYECVHRIVGIGLFKNWYFYISIISLIVPYITIISNDWRYQLIRLVRLKLLYDFYHQFCTGFKSRIAPVLMKIVIVILIHHSLACVWIFISCKNDEFPLKIDKEMYKNVVLDRDEWLIPNERKGGCARVSTINMTSKVENALSFVVPTYMENDYIVALTYVWMIYKFSHKNIIIPITTAQIYYEVVATLVISVVEIWILSSAISFVYTRLRDLYQHDYNERTLVSFLSKSGLSPTLLESLKEYTKQLWRRQRGNWLPELAQSAPICLREDILCALYMHHLETPNLLRRLPQYFLRQLAARLNRVVVFPDKFVVQEGDIFPCMYFIHEGEVEKWLKNKEGELKMVSLLTTNGYFGLIPGLFPYVPFQYSYRTRTVVDFVVLRLSDWKDLINGYPEVKEDLYAAAKQLKKDMTRS